MAKMYYNGDINEGHKSHSDVGDVPKYVCAEACTEEDEQRGNYIVDGVKKLAGLSAEDVEEGLIYVIKIADEGGEGKQAHRHSDEHGADGAHSTEDVLHGDEQQGGTTLIAGRIQCEGGRQHGQAGHRSAQEQVQPVVGGVQRNCRNRGFEIQRQAVDAQCGIDQAATEKEEPRSQAAARQLHTGKPDKQMDCVVQGGHLEGAQQPPAGFVTAPCQIVIVGDKAGCSQCYGAAAQAGYGLENAQTVLFG